MEDFALKTYGCHHVYTRENYKSDIKTILESYIPRIIITTDWDDHMDHIALSLMVDECVGELLRERKLNEPLILKTQSYTGKWEGPIDFWEKDNVTKNYNDSFGTEQAHPLNRWEDRICFVSPRECSPRLLHDSVLYKAARRYASQGADIKARQFVNDDVIFWRRHTESLTYYAKITVSSGEGKYLNDFKCLDCSDVAGHYRDYDRSIWIPDVTDNDKKVYIEFEGRKTVREIWLYENPKEHEHIENCTLRFDDGTAHETGELNSDGSCTKIILPKPVQTGSLMLLLTSVSGDCAGLTEIEVYDRRKELVDYPLPLRLWTDDDAPQRRNGIACKIEKYYFRLLAKGRGRLWPNKWFLMQKYPELEERDSFLRFWRKHIRFAAERIFSKWRRR